MSIVFPRAMPASGPASQQFMIQRVDYAAPEASGRVGGVQAGFPLWMAVWTLGRITQARADEWTAWVDSLRGSQRTFLGRDFSRPYPAAYAQAGFAGPSRPGGGAFTGAATAWSQSIDGDGNAQLTLTGLPPGFVLGYRDLIGFKWNGTGTYDRRTLARVTEPGTASGGGSVTVGIEPPVPSWVNSSAVAHLDFPACVMRMLPGGADIAAIDRRLTIQGTKLSAVQDLRP